MDRSVALVAVLLTSLVLTSGAAATPGSGLSALQSGDVETDGVVLKAAVDADGDATWTIDYRIRLDDRNTTEAFESLQADIRNNTSDYRGQFASRMRSTVGTAENVTGRSMSVTNVTVTADTTFSGQYGVVSYSFQWEGFAATEGDRLVLGDALGGLFLDADTKLTFRWPEGYELRQVAPEPTTRDGRSVTWEGPVDFGTNQPRLAIAPEGILPAWAPTAGLALLAALALGGGFWYYRQKQETGSEAASGDGAARAPAEGTPAAQEPTAAETTAADMTGEPDAESVSESESGAESEPEPSESEATAEEQTAADETPTELLSPEERVLALLSERGGRMKQKVVTEELDWSAARTSQVVGELRDAGKVESFRLGRENVLRFPDEDGEGPGSP